MNRIREAVPEDVTEIVELIVELAVYEREPDAVKLTPERLYEQLFGAYPAIYADVATAPEGGGRRIDGFALWFLNYSTWEGEHGIYLEDLYVRQEARGTGLGKQLLLHLAHIANTRGYKRVEWSVLKWNTPSIEFYRSLGAVAMDDWDTMRLAGDALMRFGSAARE
ncbi:GNAT family N-acetyltransferase [uncultured Agrococcus sp.]|uniref:GNAT family N-acetyltransferase n=1 Tax=uncultured Agrococcus sp. TaxID=382258 RepID=UPI0025F6C484|nr:GNAT family N-acetyltransferase [uncultured Agrococcus sp.]